MKGLRDMQDTLLNAREKKKTTCKILNKTKQLEIFTSIYIGKRMWACGREIKGVNNLFFLQSLCILFSVEDSPCLLTGKVQRIPSHRHNAQNYLWKYHPVCCSASHFGRSWIIKHPLFKNIRYLDSQWSAIS